MEILETMVQTPKIAVLNSSGNITKWIVFDTEDESFRNNFGGEVEIIFSPQRIHADDSICTLKMKIIQELGIHIPVSYEEIYLFAVHETTVHLRAIFESITKESTISAAQFGQILILFDIHDPELINSIPHKEKYTFDDLVSLRIDRTVQPLKYIFGKQFARGTDYMFPPNPYDIPAKYEYIPIYENPLISFENHVILNYPSPVKNTMYLTMAEDVFRYAQSNEISEIFISQMYFPMLYKKGIFQFSDLEREKEKLLNNTVKMISKTVVNSQNLVTMLYDIYRLRKDEIAYLQKGIYSFSFMINPKMIQTLPLEAIFKNLHASKEHPYIRYNPGIRRENIYRFYTEQITHNGSRIPFLGKNLIMAISKNTERMKNILFYIPISLTVKEKIEVYISIHSNGNINVYGEMDVPLGIIDLNALVEKMISPIINEINDFLYQSSYQIRDFISIHDETVEVLYLKYRAIVNVDKKVKLSTYWGILQHVFESKNMGAGKLEDGIQIRYKRVENYEDMNAESAAITELLKQTDDKREIISLLMVTNNYTEDQAIAKMVEYFNKYTKIEGRYMNRHEDIVENPGFPVKFLVEPFENKMYVIIENITGLNYISCLEKYIDSIIRITQNPKTSGVPISKVLASAKPLTVTQEESLKSKIDNVIITEDAVRGRDAKRIIQPVRLQRHVSEDAFEEEEKTQRQDEEEPEDEDDDGIFFYPEEEEEAGEGEQGEEEEEGEEEAGEESGEESGEEEEAGEEEEEEGFFMPYDDSSGSSSSPPSSSGSSESPLILNTDVIMNEAINDRDDNESSINNSGGGRKKGSTNLKKKYEEPPPAMPQNKTPSPDNGNQDEIEEYKKQLDGQHLKDKNSNIFLKRMKEREPTLFLTKAEGNFDNYSRICPHNTQRQPVILTTEEKKRIDKEHPGSYTNSISYGTDPSNPYHYICPRYWCLLTQTPLSQEEVDESMRMEIEKPGSSKCGKIIPADKDVIPSGHYIYEFKNEKQHIDKKDGKYIENSPSFILNSHPKGHCLPCCFKSAWNGEDQLKRRQKCMAQPTEDEKPKNKSKKQKLPSLTRIEEEEEEEEEKEKEKPPNQITRQPSAIKDAKYILGIDKYVLPQNRWGFLPLAAQYFLQTDNSTAVNPNNPALIRENSKTPPLLRYGVENSPKKSFIGVLCILYYIHRKMEKIPTIKEMCDTILPMAITIDQFIQYHNGSLIQAFSQKNKQPIPDDNYTNEKYTESEFVKSIDTSNESQLHFLVHTVDAYENFIEFIKNPESEINHYFLWDICAMPNPIFFPQGINLTIMQIDDNDITDNIGLLCPSNAYSSQFYVESKPTAIILKRDEFYEPIFVYDKKEFFREDSITDSLKNVLHIIRNTSKTLCTPQPSLPYLYIFKQNHIGSHTSALLQTYGYTVKSQVMNYRGKIIGLVLSDPAIFIPIFPGPPLPNYPQIFMDAEEIWQPYDFTRDELINVYLKTEKKVLCRPIIKVDEDGLIVGILTETNQFIKVKEPVAPMNDNLKLVKGIDYISTDKILETETAEDEERLKIVSKINLEEQYYSAFRTTIQNLLKDINNRDVRNEIVNIIDKEQRGKWMYMTRLRHIETLLRQIARNRIEFVIASKSIDFMEFEQIRPCSQSQSKQPKYCLYQQMSQDAGAAESLTGVIVDGYYKFLIPKKHLYPNPNGETSDNETLYFYRLSDELLRFKRIQFFMLEPNMKVPQTSYQIDTNEMILLQSLLTSTYFAGLIPFRNNAKITYNTANPITSQVYSNIVSAEEQNRFSNKKIDPSLDPGNSNCITGTQPLIGNNRTFWKQVFPKETQEFVYDQTESCTFQIILDILGKMKTKTEEQKKIVDINTLRKFLADIYKKIIEETPKLRDKIIRIMRFQGKRSIVEAAKKVADFSLIILAENYYLTSLDIWLLSDALELPIVFFGPSKLSDLEYADWSVHWIILNKKVRELLKEPHFYIRIPVRKITDFIPRYSLVTNPYKFDELRGMGKMVLEGLQPSNEFARHQIKVTDYLANWHESNIPKIPVEL